MGSQKKGVALTGCKTADAVIIFKKPPTGMVTVATYGYYGYFKFLMITRCHGNQPWSTCGRNS